MQVDEGNGSGNGSTSNFLDLSISKRLVLTTPEDFEREYSFSTEMRKKFINIVFLGLKNLLSKQDSKILSDAMVIHLRKYAKELELQLSG